MGLLENFEPPARKFPCKIATELSKLQAADKAVLVEALADEKKWPAKTLSNALKARGIQLVDSTISRHRQGHCSCLKG